MGFPGIGGIKGNSKRLPHKSFKVKIGDDPWQGIHAREKLGEMGQPEFRCAFIIQWD